MRADLWKESAREVAVHEEFEGPPLTDELVAKAEEILGVRLPASYVGLMRSRNGGYLRLNACPTDRPTTWADGWAPVNSLYGIPEPNGRELDWPNGCGEGILGTPYMIKEWGLPEGVVLLDGDGHTWVALDYRECGPAGEPSVVWLDVEMEQELRIAASFDEFIGRLMPAPEFDDPE